MSLVRNLQASNHSSSRAQSIAAADYSGSLGHCMLPNQTHMASTAHVQASACLLAGKGELALTWLLCCRSAPRGPAIDVRANRLAGTAFGAIGLSGAAPPPLAVRKLQRAKVQMLDPALCRGRLDVPSNLRNAVDVLLQVV